MKTENLAIVFVDIAGYTPRTSAQTREENLRMLRRFDGIVRPLVRACNGRVIKTIGDAYLLTFRSPTDALLCSTAIHDRLAESDKEVDPSEHFTVRAAVNVGDVRIDGGDVFGEAVNIAARIEGKAGTGEIYFSESVYLSMTKSEVPHEEIGLVELKGIAGKVRLYRVPRAAEAGYMPRRREDGEENPGSATLPYAGLGLDRFRAGTRWTSATQVLAPAMSHAQSALSKLPGKFGQGMQIASQGFSWWKSEVRRSRTVQYATVFFAILFVFVLVWTVKPAPRKASSPVQKLHRALGF